MKTVGMGAQSQQDNSVDAPKSTAPLSSWNVEGALMTVRNEVGA